MRYPYPAVDDDTFFIEDDGPGLDGTPEEIAELFSIRRPMRSTKLLRLPQRGALGNGLRVVGWSRAGIRRVTRSRNSQSPDRAAPGIGWFDQRS